MPAKSPLVAATVEIGSSRALLLGGQAETTVLSIALGIHCRETPKQGPQLRSLKACYETFPEALRSLLKADPWT